MAPPRKRVKARRLQIHVDPLSLEWLRAEAQRLDTSISDVVRRLVRKEANAWGREA